jgi:mRNA interferase MazF
VAEQDRALITVVAHTTNPRGSRFEVAITTRFLRPGVFDAQNLLTIPRAKLLRKLGVLSPTQLAAVEVAVRVWLGL